VPVLRRAKIEQRGQLRIKAWPIGLDLPAAEVLLEVMITFRPLPGSRVLEDAGGFFRRARSARLSRALPISAVGQFTRFSLPLLDAYDAVVLE